MRMNSKMRFLRVPKILVACTLIINLVACGFTPVYSENSQTGRALTDIRVAAPDTREEYLFVRHIETRLGRNDNAGLLLKYNIWIYSEGVELFGAARARQVGKVRYQLVSSYNSKVIATGSVESFTGYSSEGLLYLKARREATERLIQILVDETVTDLIIKLQAHQNPV